MNLRNRFAEVGLCFLGVLLIAFAAAPAFAAYPCTGTGVNALDLNGDGDTADPGEHPAQLNCTGGCPGPTACILKNTSGAGGAPAKFCGCPNMPEDTCCHLIAIVDPQGHIIRFEVKGTCPPCPLNGGCVMIGTGTVADPFEPACRVQ